MLAVAVAALVAAAVAGGTTLPPRPSAVASVPDEPGAIVLPDGAPTLQAVAADLDADGSRELVRTVGGDDGSVRIEAWTEAGGEWRPLAEPAQAVSGEAAFVGRPMRLLVRRVDGGDRVTLVRQPDFNEPVDPRGCCLLLDDLEVGGSGLGLTRVAEPGDRADSVHVIDLDGDGTDELLAAFSLSPLNDASSPTEGWVYRWAGDRFAAPTRTALPVGSGSTFFVLGDSDDVPGDEAAVISTAALNALFRIRLGPGDSLVAEASGLSVDDAIAVPLANGRGIAIHAAGGVQVRAWPRGERLADPLAEVITGDGRLLGVVDILGEPRVLLRRTDPEALHVLGLPYLTPPRGAAITRSPAAAALDSGPLSAYVGPVPGGGLDGEAAVLYAGRLLPSDDLPDAPFGTRQAALFGALAGAEPVGLVGRERRWLAIRHAASPDARGDDPRGGPLGPRIVEPGSAVSIAPIDVVRHPEVDEGQLEPPLEGATPIGARDLAIGPSGLVADVTAPPGSRVYLPDPDPSVLGTALTIGESGSLRVTVGPPGEPPGNIRHRLTLHVVTPAGHGYIATWPVRVLVDQPALDATAVTPPGSAEVSVTGRTAPYATLTVAGRSVPVDHDGRFSATVTLPPWPTDVTLVARDPAGNESVLTVSGVGILDYRGLPWAPIALVLVAVAGAALALRVPRMQASPPPVGDDAVLEEVDPGDRL